MSEADQREIAETLFERTPDEIRDAIKLKMNDVRLWSKTSTA
jgi:hypothetical protein